MLAFRTLLMTFTIFIWIFTLIVTYRYGMTLVPIFVENIKALNWSGQFNLDFWTYLILSGLWIAWRKSFSLGGILLGALASFAGMMFLAPYLLLLSYKSSGDVIEILLGNQRDALSWKTDSE